MNTLLLVTANLQCFSGAERMEVRAKDGKVPLLFEWDSTTQTVDLIRKDMYYKIHLDKHSYCVREEHSKYEYEKQNPTKQLNN